MITHIEQGQVLRLEGIKYPVLVVSKTFYNKTGYIIGCAIVQEAEENAINIYITTDRLSGIVLCDEVKKFDIHFRGFQELGTIDILTRMQISDIIQGLFEY